MILMQYYGGIREFTKCKEEAVAAATLGEAMEYVKNKYGKQALKAMKASMLTLDGVRIERLKPRLPLPEGSAVGVFPLCCGG